MGIEQYPTNLTFLATRPYASRYITEESKQILQEKATSLAQDLRKSGTTVPVWRVMIPSAHPLLFVKNNVDGLELQVDATIEIEGRGDEITKQNITVRVWCLDEDLCYREDLDAPQLKEAVEACGSRRVMSRFHFDLKNPNAKKPEPRFHLHIGGNASPDENYWLPKQIRVPRFPYPPMDIVLLFEFVLINFFVEQWEELKKKPEWRSLVRKSQEIFQKDYLEQCVMYHTNEADTLSGHLTA